MLVGTISTLQSLIRLSQARARTSLLETVSVLHVNDVIEIFKASVGGGGHLEEDFVLECNRGPSGRLRSGKSVASRAGSLRKAISKSYPHSSLVTENELQALSESIGGDKLQFYDVLEAVRTDGFLLKKPGGLFQVNSG
eukprot:GHVR01190695.1.p1 GENE.GHVR01190695.1~~GHVR01190695.1.p1  ORF type:complete len:139 (-),score=33.47 GHVR01190695.1:167-583(-)